MWSCGYMVGNAFCVIEINWVFLSLRPLKSTGLWEVLIKPCSSVSYRPCFGSDTNIVIWIDDFFIVVGIECKDTSKRFFSIFEWYNESVWVYPYYYKDNCGMQIIILKVYFERWICTVKKYWFSIFFLLLSEFENSLPCRYKLPFASEPPWYLYLYLLRLIYTIQCFFVHIWLYIRYTLGG
jgi:hypothetical protein